MSITEEDASQEPNPTFLVGSDLARKTFDNTCPAAKTITGFSETLERWVVVQIRCKRWGCRHCGERKVTHYGWKCEDARPNKLITLTVSNSLWDSPRAAYEGTKSKVTELAVKLRRKFGEFEYFKVLEVTKAGWPHYHLIVRSEYIPQRTISAMWAQLTGATIVDVRRIKKHRDVYFYVVKYLAKQRYIPWTTRRVSWSKNFFLPTKFDKGEGLKLADIGWFDEHPHDVIRRYYHPYRLEAYSSDCWAIEQGYGYSAGEPFRFKKKPKTPIQAE